MVTHYHAIEFLRHIVFYEERPERQTTMEQWVFNRANKILSISKYYLLNIIYLILSIKYYLLNIIYYLLSN